MKVAHIALALTVLLGTSPAVPFASGDRSAYQGVVDLRAAGDDFIVVHHHDWSEATRASRHRMIRTHQNPFRDDNDYAHIAWRSRDGGRLLRRRPGPALTWLGVSLDSRYVIGLSKVMLDNPYQLVVYDRAGELLLKRHIGPEVACLTPGRYRELRRTYARQFESLNERVWTAGGVVYVDYLTMDMPRRLGPLWDALYPAVCRSPLSPNFSQTVTNWIFWYDEADPTPEVVEQAGQPMALRLKDPKGQVFAVPFRPDLPSD
jgi:hypothetical protein